MSQDIPALICRAQLALTTGQPRLATLYMVRATELAREQRREARQARIAAQFRSGQTVAVWNAYADTIRDVWDVIRDAFRPAIELVATMQQLQANQDAHRRAYGLAAPSEGGL